MARFNTIKMSTIAATEGKTLNPEYLLRLKERLELRGVDENPDTVKEEIAAMNYEAQDQMRNALEARAKGNELLRQAREQEKEAEELSNHPAQTIKRKMGI